MCNTIWSIQLEAYIYTSSYVVYIDIYILPDEKYPLKRMMCRSIEKRWYLKYIYICVYYKDQHISKDFHILLLIGYFPNGFSKHAVERILTNFQEINYAPITLVISICSPLKICDHPDVGLSKHQKVASELRFCYEKAGDIPQNVSQDHSARRSTRTRTELWASASEPSSATGAIFRRYSICARYIDCNVQ